MRYRDGSIATIQLSDAMHSSVVNSLDFSKAMGYEGEIEPKIREAFHQARIRGKQDWRRMAWPVLKNRLLDLTSRTFDERDYGARTGPEFAARFPHLLEVDASTVPVTLTLRAHEPDDESRPLIGEVVTELTATQEAAAPQAVAEPDAAETYAAVDEALNRGDLLTYGELLWSTITDGNADETLARIISAWAAPTTRTDVKTSLDAIVADIADFDRENLAKAVVAAKERLGESRVVPPVTFGDIAFRVENEMASVFGVAARRLETRCAAASARLTTTRARLITEVASFKSTNAAAAKPASIEVFRAAKAYRELCVIREWPLLRVVETVLGALFRKFCESYERNDVDALIRRAADLRQQITTSSATDAVGRGSRVWRDIVEPVLAHVTVLVEDAIQRVDASTAPVLSLADRLAKLDLRASDTAKEVTCRIINTGQGRALSVRFMAQPQDTATRIEVIAPSGTFELESRAERLITLSVTSIATTDFRDVRVALSCRSQSEREFTFDDLLRLEQQAGEPMWDTLIGSPPYTLNPVRRRDQLYGRDAVMTDLLLNANSQTSTFLWGSKRVGKTSVLQVLANELSETGSVASIILRMGEIGSMHEGEMAHVLASRIASCFSNTLAPREDEFGAGLRRLIPFVERLPIHITGPRPLVIIDEFDDLDPAFYSGERGRQFVKALRSLSEVGVTFFFVGSERMDAIYRRHAADLNKWVNVHLDRIESLDDCRALITSPVRGAIEFELAAIDFLVDYCGRNPFYLNVVCMELFKRCAQERRTYVGMVDVQTVRRQLLKTLGSSNFAHFWEDNPELDLGDRRRQAAENAVILACFAQGGGQFESIDDVEEQQSALALKSAERLTRSEVERAVNRLKHRRVVDVVINGMARTFRVGPPIFMEWLSENGEALLEYWRSFKTAAASESGTVPSPRIAVETVFPISEDDLIAVTQGLVYLGKQKDVAEVRSWLRQFDDDNRIEIAFLLLKRLAERGYVNEGAQTRTLMFVEEAVNKRRLDIGQRAWRMIRQRRDNLCVAYVDSEVKSGAAAA